jgi:hypothetical protein
MRDYPAAGPQIQSSREVGRRPGFSRSGPRRHVGRYDRHAPGRAHEVEAATLPSRVQHLGDRRLMPSCASEITSLTPSNSRLRAEIDEKVNAFLARPIEDDWPYLWIDATYVKVRQDGCIVSVAVIVAVGVNSDGRREMSGWTSALPKPRHSGRRSCASSHAEACAAPHGAQSAARRPPNASPGATAIAITRRHTGPWQFQHHLARTRSR